MKGIHKMKARKLGNSGSKFLLSALATSGTTLKFRLDMEDFRGQVKLPKVYIRDSGLLHQLLGIRTMPELLSHPKCGASWEGYVIEEIISSVQPDEVYFWATHAGAELDLLLFKDGRRFGVEIKRADAPRLTPSMRTALEDLRLDRLAVIYPGERRYALAEQVEVVPLMELCAKGGNLLK